MSTFEGKADMTFCGARLLTQSGHVRQSSKLLPVRRRLGRFAAHAQQAATPVIGYLDVGSPDGSAPIVTAFRKGLARTGQVEGKNVTIEYRWADGRNDRLPELAADLVRQKKGP